MNDQIKTDSGYQFGGQTFQNQTRTDSQGNQYQVAIPISSVTTPQTPFQLPQAPAPTNFNDLTSTMASQQDAANQLALDRQKAQQEVSSIGALSDTLAGKSAFTAQQNDATGLNAANEAAIAKSAEITALGKQAAAAQQENIAQGRQLGSVGSFVAGQSNEIERNRAIKALNLSAELDALKGNIDIAKSKVQQAVDAKYSGIEQQLATRLQMFNLNQKLYENLSQDEQKQFDRAKYATEQKQKEIALEKADKLEVENLIVDATPNAPASVIANAKKIAEQGGSKIAVAQALGVYGGDFLKNELLKEQIKQVTANINKTKSETIKVDTQTSNLIAQPTGVITAPNGDAIGIPNETLAAIGKLKLGEGQANAVAFVSRMIQASKAIDQQLGEIKPTGGFYETSGYDPTSAGSSIGRFVSSDQSRTYNTNAQDFIRAKLRKESGAAIGKDEFDADAAIYTPAGAGLDEKDLILARTKRDEAIKSMIAQAGPAAPYLQQYYEQSKTQGDAFMSENPQLNSWYQNTAGAVQTSTAQATTGASSYGFTDNQTK